MAESDAAPFTKRSEATMIELNRSGVIESWTSDDEDWTADFGYRGASDCNAPDVRNEVGLVKRSRPRLPEAS